MGSKTLVELLRDVKPLEVSGIRDILIQGISYDFRRIRPGFLAGKGHEEYQIMKTGLVPFSDRAVALEAFRAHKTAGPGRRADVAKNG